MSLFISNKGSSFTVSVNFICLFLVNMIELTPDQTWAKRFVSFRCFVSFVMFFPVSSRFVTKQFLICFVSFC